MSGLGKAKTEALAAVIEELVVVKSWLSGARADKVETHIQQLRDLHAGETPEVEVSGPAAAAEPTV